MRTRQIGLVALLAAPALLLAGPATLAAARTGPAAPVATATVTPSLYAAAAKAGHTPVIVLLKGRAGVHVADTRANHARHAAALAAEQSPVLTTLTRGKAAKVHAYASFDALSATVDAATLHALAANPAVAEVVPDSMIKMADAVTAADQAAAATSTNGVAVAPKPGVCSTQKTKPQLNPEALQTTHTDSDDPTAKTARSLGATGAGVTVAWFAEGIDVNNPDFIRPDGSKVFTDYQDFTGEGTAAPTAAGEAFLDASSIAAQGREVYNVSHYSALPLSRPCYIRVEGVAPGASMVALKVFGDSTLAVNSNFLDAIDYAVNTDHVDVLSQSFGNNGVPDTAVDVIRAADDAAVAAGVTVVASSGDAGVTNTIGSPASDPAVISAAATTTHRLFLQNGYGGARFPGVTGWTNDNISSLSSGGVTEAGRTVDIAAPGELNWVVCTPDTQQYPDCANLLGKPSPVVQSGGTSESAPLTAGAAALVIQAYRQTHGGASPTPAQIKQVLVSTADDIAAPGDQQGAGELDTYRAVLAARSLPTSAGTPAGQGDTFVTDTGQIDASGAPGTAVSKTVRVTNTGADTQTVAVAGRTLGAYSSIKSTKVVLSASSPTQLDWQGYLDPYQTVHFKVPAGVDRLKADIAYQGATAALTSRGRLTLVDPLGRLTSYSLPQGVGNFGDVQVAHPTAGTWTGYIYTRPASAHGSLGTYLFGAQVANYTTFGTVSPSSVTLAPGASAPVTFTTTTPATPGDEVASLVLSSAASGVPTTIPVILRSLIPLTTAGTSFTGLLTGGNGRSTVTGQTEFYQFDVAQGAPELNASVTLATNPNNPLFLALVDPNGNEQAYGSNVFTPDVGGSTTNTLSGQVHALAPMAGTWDLVVNFAPTVSGKQLSQPFTVTLDDAAVAATAKNLPTAGTTLPAGSKRTVKVKITNTGPAYAAYFIDARSTASTTYALYAPQTVTLPPTAQPGFLVPTNTTAVLGALTSSVPVQFDMDPVAGDTLDDPDVQSSVGTTAYAAYSATPTTQGVWSINPSEVGPYGATGAPQVQATASMAVTTRAFDQGVVSPTGDLWLGSLTGSTPLAPIVVAPGQTVTIPVTITAHGASGSKVTGTLFVDDLAYETPAGALPDANQVAAVPYGYTVG